MGQFPNSSTIGIGLHIDWPARSPDLTSCDFFLWGYIWCMCNAHSIISGNCNEQQQMCLRRYGTAPTSGRSSHVVLSRMRRCIAIGGHQVEAIDFRKSAVSEITYLFQEVHCVTTNYHNNTHYIPQKFS
jgi:hypothetical protein